MTKSTSVKRKTKLRKPGRPKKSSVQTDANDIRRNMLNATIALIAERGFDGFVLRDVAEAVGVHTALVGYYFKSKTQLERAALDLQIQEAEVALGRLLVSAELPPYEALKVIFLGFIDVLHRGEASFCFNRWVFAKSGYQSNEISKRLCAPILNLITVQLAKLMPEASGGEIEARAMIFYTLAEDCANVRWNQLKHLNAKSPENEFLEHYYRVIERELLPELCGRSLTDRNERHAESTLAT